MGPVTAATDAIGAGVAVAGVTAAAEATTIKGHRESPDSGGPDLDMEIPAAVVEIGRGASGGGAVPARRATRNGDTSGAAIGEADASIVDMVEAMETTTPVGRAAAAAVDSEAAEVIDRDQADTM
jgi:hypothetical protein